jgi:hypothetical protein
LGDIARGFVNISTTALHFLGLLAVLLAMSALARPEMRLQTAQNIQTWLFTRLNISEADDAKQQVLLRSLAAQSLGAGCQSVGPGQPYRSKYRIAPEPLNAIVLEVFDLASRAKLEPTLILAVIGMSPTSIPLPTAPSAPKA